MAGIFQKLKAPRRLSWWEIKEYRKVLKHTLLCSECMMLLANNEQCWKYCGKPAEYTKIIRGRLLKEIEDERK